MRIHHLAWHALLLIHAMTVWGPHSVLFAQGIRNNEKKLDDTLVYKLTKKKTAWIVCDRGNGRESTGTGVLIDAENLYILTAAHVVNDTESTTCFFPYPDAGDRVNDPGFYRDRADTLGIRGETVASKASKDLALIRLRPSRQQMSLIPKLPIPFATMNVEEAQSLLTVGSSGAYNGALWRHSGGSARLIHRKRINYPNQEVDATIIENQVASNPGDSGGPVMSSYGVLVGINSGSDTRSDLIRFAINRNEIQTFLEEVPFPIAVSRLMTLEKNGNNLTYAYQIFGKNLMPKYQHVLVMDQGIRVISSTITPLQ